MRFREALLRETLNGLRDRATRYRRLSSLLGCGDDDDRLQALAGEIEEWVEQIERTMEKVHSEVAATHVLVAEIDACIGRAGQKPGFPKLRRGCARSADDLREAARLCVEEARAASDPSERRELSAKIADLAGFAEMIDRMGADSEA
jgi:hypothetical protein